MSLEFLDAATAADGALARSARWSARRSAAGARFEVRDGWNVAVAYAPPSTSAAAETVGWADVSHLPKLELQGDPTALDARSGAALRSATPVRRDGAWWCRLTPDRALVIGEPTAGDAATAEASTTSTSPALRRADASSGRGAARCSRASARSTCARR